jgi:hypothetical protein
MVAAAVAAQTLEQVQMLAVLVAQVAAVTVAQV